MESIIKKEIETLCQKVENKKDFFPFKPKMLLSYVAIKDSIPFEIYFKNQFKRLIKNNAVKKNLP